MNSELYKALVTDLHRRGQLTFAEFDRFMQEREKADELINIKTDWIEKTICDMHLQDMKIEELQEQLDLRDKFLVSKGLWVEFAAERWQSGEKRKGEDA
jgi:hypothetical protein